MPERSRSDDFREKLRKAEAAGPRPIPPLTEPGAPPGAIVPLEPPAEVNDRLTGAARTIGHAAGTAMHSVESMRRRFQVIRGRGRQRAGKAAQELAHGAESALEETGARVTRMARELGERASQRAEQVSERTAEAAQRIQESTEAALQSARRRAAAGLEQARQSASHWAQERPEQVIVAGATAGFLLGLGLRLLKGVRHD